MMSQALYKKLSQLLGDKTVLVIEPSVNYRTSIKQFLTNLRVSRAKLVGSVGEARRELLTAKVGLFIVEWSNEGENGLQFCRWLRKEAAYKDTPFMLLSTENLKKDVVLASELKIHAYLLKPFSYEEFSYQIGSMIKHFQNPQRINQVLDLAMEQVERGELQIAETLFKEALAIQSKSARALTGLGLVAMKGKKPTKALEFLNLAAEANPDYIEAYRLMLAIHESKKDRTAVLQVASILHEMSPENPRYTLILAKCYLELSALEASEKFFKKTVHLSPRMAEGYKGLGYVYLAQEEYEKARKNLKKALDLDSQDAGTLNAIGTAYVRIGHFQEGIVRYMMALKIVPNEPRLLFNIAHAQEKIKDFEKAKWYYAQALLQKPDFDKAKRGLERLESQVAESSKENFGFELSLAPLDSAEGTKSDGEFSSENEKDPLEFNINTDSEKAS